MYAVIQTGGKQYRVSPGELIKIEKMSGVIGDEVRFETVLFVGENESSVTDPISEGVTVRGTIVDQNRSDKIVVFKFKRRKMYRRKSGHRQEMTAVRIEEIISAKSGSESKAQSPQRAVDSKESKPAVAKKQTKPKKQSASTKQKSKKAKTPVSKSKKKVSSKPAASKTPKSKASTSQAKGAKASKSAPPSKKKTAKKVASKESAQDKE